MSDATPLRIADLKRLLRAAAPEFKLYGQTFWHVGDSLCVMVHLQKSQWADGIYVNVGATPAALLEASRPMRAGFWPLSVRATRFASPVRKSFDRLEDSARVGHAEMGTAFAWLISWIRTNMIDVRAFRAAFDDPESWLMQLGPMRDGLWSDWLDGRLKPRGEYYTGAFG